MRASGFKSVINTGMKPVITLFVLSCALCFALTVHGLRSAQGDAARGPTPWLTGLAIGVAIAAPVYWMFTKLLSIRLPGLTSTGWL